MEATSIKGVDPLLSLEEAAQVLGISPRTLQTWIRTNRIPYLRIGKLTKFAPQSLRAWMAAQEVGARVGSGRE